MTEEEEAAVWVSCVSCDAMPGDPCTGEATVHKPIHDRRIDMLRLFKKEEECESD